MLDRYEMIRSITDSLETASDAEVESIYWMIAAEFAG